MEIALPPREMRQLVGPVEPEEWNTRTLPDLPASAFENVLDFGCGCGRLARELLLFGPEPHRYLGIDLHRGMITWCRQNIAHAAFRFEHHDVWNYNFNPRARARVRSIPGRGGIFSLVIAYSVFTHLSETQATHYIAEIDRVLAEDGIFFATWLLFDKRDFPVLSDLNNALYVSTDDPGAAVYFDAEWMRATLRERGLVATSVTPPVLRGFQWAVTFARDGAEVDFPNDEAPRGKAVPPGTPPHPASIGLRRQTLPTG